MNSSLEKDSQQICQVADWMFGFGPKPHVTQAQTESQISRSAPLNARNLIKRRPAGHFLRRPLGQTAGCRQQPPPGGVEARRGGCEEASDQRGLELCVTCRGEAAECCNS